MASVHRPAPAAPGDTRHETRKAASSELAQPRADAARALYVGALALLAVRVTAAFVPGRWLWGLDLGRDLAPASFIVPLLLTLGLAVPAVGRAVAGVIPRGPRAFTALAVTLAVALAVFSWTHPDRALYTGDASLRHAGFTMLKHPEVIAEQALGGDLVLHYAFPRWVSEHTPFDAEQVGRAQGALLALLTALAGWRVARALGAQGELALAVMALVACTGALALDNGYGKGSVEVACLTSIAAVGIVHAARTGGGLGTVGLAVGAALLLHRSALLLVPAWLVCAGIALRAGGWRRGFAGAATVAGLLAPIAALAIVGTRLVHIIGSFDAHKHLPQGGTGAVLAAVFKPAHLADLFHTLCLIVPLVLLAPLLAWLAPRPTRREALVWGAFVLPPLALLMIVIPHHGLARDWDVFAFAGSALAAALAWRVAAVLGGPPRVRGVALLLALVCAVPALQWAALQSDAERMWSRAEAILVGPPARGDSERADGLGTIGVKRYANGQYASALRLFQRSAAAAPNPSMFVWLGMAESMLGHPDIAMRYFVHAATLNPDMPPAWRGVAAAASALGDRARMQQAVDHLEQLEPTNPTLAQAREWLKANPAPH